MSAAKYMVGQRTIPNKMYGYTYCIRNNNGNFYHLGGTKRIYQNITMFCGFTIKLIERVVDGRKYRVLSIKIDGAQQTLEAHLTIEGVEQLQTLIDERRAINILGINFLHKKLANRLTQKYDNISNPK